MTSNLVMENSDNLINSLRVLVNKENATEQDLQFYMERNPELVLGGHSREYAYGFIISQFPLGADFRCDFAFYTHPSFGMFLHLVEIESPKLQLFTNLDEFTSDFSHAYQQLEDWSGWIRKNKDGIEHLLQPLVDCGYAKHVPYFDELFLELVVGRRAQLSNTRRQRRWKEKISRLPRYTSIRTWDGYLESLEKQSLKTGNKCLRYNQQSFHEI